MGFLDDDRCHHATVYQLSPAFQKEVTRLLREEARELAVIFDVAKQRLEQAEQLPESPAFSDAQRAILAQVDGRRTLFEIWEIIEDEWDEERFFIDVVLLADADFIRAMSTKQAIALERARIHQKARENLVRFAAFIPLLFLVLLIGIVVGERAERSYAIYPHIENPNAGNILVGNARLRAARDFLHVFQLVNLDFPERLHELVDIGWLSPEALHGSSRQIFVYKKAGTGYVLAPAPE